MRKPIMKTRIYPLLLVLSLLGMSSLYTACSSPDELVPLPKEDANTSQVYKMPDPVLLNDVETAAVDEILKEYNEQVTP